MQSERLITTESYEWSQKKELAQTVVVEAIRTDHFARVSEFADSIDHLTASTLPDMLDEIGHDIVILESAFSEYGSSTITIASAKKIYLSLLGNIDIDIFPNQEKFTFIEFLQYYSKLSKFKNLKQSSNTPSNPVPSEDSAGKQGILSSSAAHSNASNPGACYHQRAGQDILPRLDAKTMSTDQKHTELIADEMRRRRIEKLQFPTIFSTGIVDSRRILQFPSKTFIRERNTSCSREIDFFSVGIESPVLFVPLSGTDNVRKASRADVLETIEFWEKVQHIFATKDGRKELKRIGGIFSISG